VLEKSMSFWRSSFGERQLGLISSPRRRIAAMMQAAINIAPRSLSSGMQGIVGEQIAKCQPGFGFEYKSCTAGPIPAGRGQSGTTNEDFIKVVGWSARRAFQERG